MLSIMGYPVAYRSGAPRGPAFKASGTSSPRPSVPPRIPSPAPAGMPRPAVPPDVASMLRQAAVGSRHIDAGLSDLLRSRFGAGTKRGMTGKTFSRSARGRGASLTPNKPFGRRSPAPALPGAAGAPGRLAAARAVSRLAFRLLPFVGIALTIWDLLQLLQWVWEQLTGSTSWENAGWTMHDNCIVNGVTHRTVGSSGTPAFSCLNRQALTTYPLNSPISSGATWFFGLEYDPIIFGGTEYPRWDVVATYTRGSSTEDEPVTVPGGVAPIAPARPTPELDQLVREMPEANPIGQPRQMPGRVPFRRAARANPYRYPFNAHGQPSRLRRAVPRGWEVSQTRGAPPRIREVPPPAAKRPPRREQDKKGSAQRAVARIAAAAFAVTEYADLVDSLIGALPDRLQDAAPTKLHERSLFLAEHFREMDVAKAIENVIVNQIEDRIVGKISALGEGALKNTFGATSYRLPS